MQFKSLLSFALVSVVSVSAWAVPNRVVDHVIAAFQANDEKVTINEVTVVVQGADADFSVSCQNEYKIGRVIGDCDPDKSRGWKSSHKCEDRGGRFYYCWRNGAGQCFDLRNVGQQFENGECFS